MSTGNRDYYGFWAFQYLARNQEYRDAWAVHARQEERAAQGLPYYEGDEEIDDIRENYQLLYTWGFIPPDFEMYTSQTVWVRDDVTGRGYFPWRLPLTSDVILETLLLIRKEQGISTPERNIACSYVIPQRIEHLFRDKQEISDWSTWKTSCQGKMEFRGDDLVVFDFLKTDLRETLSRVQQVWHFANTYHEAPPKEFPIVHEGKAGQAWHLPRAVGLWLYDEHTGQNGTKTECITTFLDEYGSEDILPKKYRDPRNLAKLLNATIECVDKREVLPMT
jgi:hypothetical protein